MKNSDTHDYTGYSESSLVEAINDALQKADEPSHFKVVETRSSWLSEDRCHYQVTLTMKGVL